MNIIVPSPGPLELFNGRVFRILLDCLARPGRVGTLPDPPLTDPPPLDNGDIPNPVAVAACMSLLDQTVSFAQAAGTVWLSADHPLTHWITLRSNARPVPAMMADFALLHTPASVALLEELKQGTLICPEHSCTVFLCVPEIIAGGATLRLSGPGIAGQAMIGLPGMTRTEIVALADRPGQFPLGIDIFLIDRHQRCAGLPRTVRIGCWDV
ncbi:phosphonate C-P lyase system protein PhnH [Roseiflexus sp.]